MPKIRIICCTVPEIWRVMNVIVIFYFGLYFVLLPPLTARKIKISKKWKKLQKMSSFYTIVPKIMIIWYIVPEIWRMTDVNVIFHFGLYFALLTVQKIKFHRNKKNTWRYHHFTSMYQKLWLYDVRFLRNGVRRTDGRKKWHIEVGAPPKNSKPKLQGYLKKSNQVLIEHNFHCNALSCNIERYQNWSAIDLFWI